MYNDTVTAANKIISNKDLEEIFIRMDDAIKENEQICKRETMENQNLDREAQHWTTRDFSGTFKCEFDFYDSTTITVDNYINFITIYNNRLDEIRRMYITYRYEYWLGPKGIDSEYITQTINMDIYEHKMDINVRLSSVDKKMDDIYELIKEKILNAPERYDRIIQKRSSIISKIELAAGIIPSLIICSLLAIVQPIRQIYGTTFVGYPIMVLVLAYLIGAFVYSGKLDNLYSTIIPNKKSMGYDRNKGKVVYKDDLDNYTNTSEIIIGKNIDNLKKRKTIADIENKYSEYFTMELLLLLVLSILMVLLGRLL